LLDFLPGSLPPLNADSIAALFDPPAQPPRRCRDTRSPQEASRPGTLAEALSHIPPDSYHTWVQIGMALKATMGDAGFELWNTWSSRSPKYDARQMAGKWQSFSGQGITAGTLYHIAKQHGWRRSRSAVTS
jgi:hypothetical protein